MTPAESREVLATPSRDILDFDPAVLDTAYALTRGQPFLLPEFRGRDLHPGRGGVSFHHPALSPPGSLALAAGARVRRNGGHTGGLLKRWAAGFEGSLESFRYLTTYALSTENLTNRSPEELALCSTSTRVRVQCSIQHASERLGGGEARVALQQQ